MSAKSQLKIVCFGSIDGNLSKLSEKIQSVHNSKNGPFDLFLITGNLFKPISNSANKEMLTIDNQVLAESLVNNEFKFPAPTYFINGNQELPEAINRKVKKENYEICKNFYFLGKSGFITTAEGVKIAFLGGTLNQLMEIKEGREEVYSSYSTKEIEALLSKPRPAYTDILLTYDWPTSIENHSEKAKNILYDNKRVATEEVMKIANFYKPKYHFCTSTLPKYFEREPYYLKEEGKEEVEIVRFISLNNFINDDKEKGLYAFNLKIGLTTFNKSNIPDRTTEDPYKPAHRSNGKRSIEHDDNITYFYDPMTQPSTKKAVPPENYICKKCRQPGHYIKDCPKDIQNNDIHLQDEPPSGYICRKCNIPGHFVKNCPNPTKPNAKSKAADCWFCLSNPNISKELIVSIGEELYTSIAKGTLIDPFSESCIVPGGGNLLLLPIVHDSNIHEAMATNLNLEKEITSYKTALEIFFKKFNCFPVYFEITRSYTGQHAHIQVVPVPFDLESMIEDVFKEQAKKDGLELLENYKPSKNESFILVELNGGKTLGCTIQRGVKVNLQFGRQAIGELLNIPDRVDWRVCAYTTEQEKEMKDSFLKEFGQFDPLV